MDADENVFAGFPEVEKVCFSGSLVFPLPRSSKLHFLAVLLLSSLTR